MKRILVATDGLDGSDRAVGFSTNLAKATGADLLIANVVGGYGLPGGVLVHLSQPRNAWLKELLTGHSAEVLTKARDWALRAGLARVEVGAGPG